MNKYLLSGYLITAVEWMEYGIYGYFADIIGKNFFVSNDETMLLLYSYAVFAAGFLFRPLGGWIFGFIGDVKGRKNALILSLVIMGSTSVMMSVLPNYDRIGVCAPISLMILRLLQSVAVGGSYGGSFVFVIEGSPLKKAGFYSSISASGVLGGLLVGSAVAMLMAKFFDADDLQDFGWRIPYLFFGFITACTVYFVRKINVKAEIFNEGEVKELGFGFLKILQILYKEHFPSIIHAISIILLDAVGIYTMFVFFCSYITTSGLIEVDDMLFINTINMVVMVFLIPAFGRLVDKYSARNILLLCSIGYILVPIPLFLWINMAPGYFQVFICQFIFAILMAMCYGSLPLKIFNMFPKSIRYSGCALSFNFCVGVFGGLTPFLLTLLTDYLNNNIIPGYVLCAVGVLSAISLILSR